ncbi:hypothetical protein B2J93_4696 [Marssonina coronariae]|uniref:Uncharacterized protein n=1 Tax=Diplocarpon coronariae TaxID=2795749 RepID=A0A218Z3L7_9HELO|nr:hypothetical protein B2J93_4696 [Marssonina coronariae]
MARPRRVVACTPPPGSRVDLASALAHPSPSPGASPTRGRPSPDLAPAPQLVVAQPALRREAPEPRDSRPGGPGRRRCPARRRRAARRAASPEKFPRGRKTAPRLAMVGAPGLRPGPGSGLGTLVPVAREAGRRRAEAEASGNRAASEPGGPAVPQVVIWGPAPGQESGSGEGSFDRALGV